MESIQERILEILELENVTPYKFCKDLGFSQGFLSKRGAIGTDKYLKIIKYLPEYNPMWILNSEGQMFNVAEPIDESIPEEVWQEIADDRKYTIQMQKEKISTLEKENDNLKKDRRPYKYGMVAED